MLFLICNVIHSFGVNIGPTTVTVSPVGTLLAVGPSHGDLQHCALYIISCLTIRPSLLFCSDLSFFVIKEFNNNNNNLSRSLHIFGVVHFRTYAVACVGTSLIICSRHCLFVIHTV